METRHDKTENIFEDVLEYIRMRKELLRLQAAETVSGVISNFTSVIIIVLIFLMAFIFISITLAHLSAEWWGHEYAGYLTVAVLYIIIGILMVKFKKSWLANPIRNSIIKQILSKQQHD